MNCMEATGGLQKGMECISYLGPSIGRVEGLPTQLAGVLCFEEGAKTNC
jgi:hypothetical protein